MGEVLVGLLHQEQVDILTLVTEESQVVAGLGAPVQRCRMLKEVHCNAEMIEGDIGDREIFLELRGI